MAATCGKTGLMTAPAKRGRMSLVLSGRIQSEKMEQVRRTTPEVPLLEEV